MKYLRCLVALPVLSLSLGAQTPAAPQLPDRPAAAAAKYKDKWLPVVGADANGPIVVADGNVVTLSASTGILLSIGDHYADGFVTIKDVYSADVPPSTDPDVIASNEMKATLVDVKASLTSDVDIPDAYALLVAYAPNPNQNAPQALAVMVRKIGDLTAGNQKSFTARLPKFDQNEGQGWNILVFDQGRQVRSTGMGDILPGYFDRLDTAKLKKQLAERLTKATDAPIGVSRQMPLGLPDAVKAKYHGTTVIVEIRIGSDGRVLWARPVGLTDADLTDALNKGFSSWLFLPPMKDGALTAGSVKIPVKL